ncbi:DUF4145 domain-containing protein [Rubripirellula amarantea]|nr:DUF4145 domain-containing protein [Rubripirellula amarantea]
MDSDLGEYIYEKCFPKYVQPPLKLIQVSSAVPISVVRSLDAAFRLFLVDHAASLNAVRTTLEVFMDELKVPRRKKTQKTDGTRKSERRSLHNRIEYAITQRKSKAHHKDALLAVKTLGNDGSHGTKTTFDNVADAFDVLESLLAAFYPGDGQTTDQIVRRTLNRRR